MRRYIRADLYRILRRIKHWVFIAIFALIAYISFDPFGSESTGTVNYDVMMSMVKWMPAVLGFVEILFVFGDDFRGKSAQIAIGIGIDRFKVVLVKLIDMVIVYSIDLAGLTLFSVALCLPTKGRLPLQLFWSLLAAELISILACAAFTALAMIIMFAAQDITLGLIIYLLLATGLLKKLITLLASLGKISRFHLDTYTLSNCVSVLRARALLGSFNIVTFLGILIYIAIGIGATYAVYRKKELEF